MQQEQKYESIKFLIEGGLITSFYQIPDHLTKAAFSRDLGMNYNRFLKCLQDPRGFTIQEILNFAAVLNTEPVNIVDLILKDYVINKRGEK